MNTFLKGLPGLVLLFSGCSEMGFAPMPTRLSAESQAGVEN